MECKLEKQSHVVKIQIAACGYAGRQKNTCEQKFLTFQETHKSPLLCVMCSRHNLKCDRVKDQKRSVLRAVRDEGLKRASLSGC